MTAVLADEMMRLADVHFSAVVSRVPKDRIDRFLLFVEIVRATDYWSTVGHRSIKESQRSEHQLDLMHWGWNAAIALLFEPFDVIGAFPMLESTPQTRGVAISLLQELGKVSLFRRLSDMVRYGIVEVTKHGDSFAVRMSSDARAQFADTSEIDRLQLAEHRVQSSKTQWRVVSMKEIDRNPKIAGAFWAKASSPVRSWIRDDIDELIRPLVRPWETGRGVMVAYDARVEVDKHFMAEALDLSTGWRESAGIHPEAKLGTVTGAHVSAVMAALISLHSKHVRCVLVAGKQFKNVSIPQSLTIWGPRLELEVAISEMTGLREAIVHSVLDVIAMKADQAKRMRQHSTPLIPLLFDLGNGHVLRPVASLTRNPFTTAVTLHRWDDPRTDHTIAADRENWMRSDLYGLFRGRRYKCVLGNVKLRRESAVVTDIDAMVYDTLTGDLGVFQLKWQDYSTNDARQLRSKATNLATELQTWTLVVQDWIEENGLLSLGQSARIKLKLGERISSVYLFAISRAVARTQGYGIATNAPGLAVAVWPQFSRVRAEIGPSPNVLNDIHKKLIDEQNAQMDVVPIPVVIELAGTKIHFHDLWNRLEEQSIGAKRH